MKDLLDLAASYRLYAMKKCTAYYTAAEYYLRKHTRLGIAATALSALVGTAVFANLTQKGDSLSSWLPPSALPWVSLCVLVLSAAAPVLIALHTFLYRSGLLMSQRLHRLHPPGVSCEALEERGLFPVGRKCPGERLLD